MNLSLSLLWLVKTACLVAAVWALIDCAVRPTQTFVAAGKLTKPAWLAITAGAAVLILLFPPLHVLSLAAIVASIVYLVDVRPAVRGVQGPGRW